MSCGTVVGAKRAVPRPEPGMDGPQLFRFPTSGEKQANIVWGYDASLVVTVNHELGPARAGALEQLREFSTRVQMRR
jgi:hypothetical protein